MVSIRKEAPHGVATFGPGFGPWFIDNPTLTIERQGDGFYGNPLADGAEGPRRMIL